MAGTNYVTPATTAANINVSQTDGSGNAILCTGSTPSAVAGFAIGCLVLDSTTGIVSVNTGSATSCTFVRVGGQ